jgi:hypothetical protein
MVVAAKKSSRRCVGAERQLSIAGSLYALGRPDTLCCCVDRLNVAVLDIDR